MGMEDFQYLLGDLATAFREDALWGVATIQGRFRVDPFEVPLGGHEPGLGETQIWYYCDRAIVPKPWPVLGDLLVIRQQVYEIVQLDEDDIGEFGFRLIRRAVGLSTVTSEGTASGNQPVVNPLTGEIMGGTGPTLAGRIPKSNGNYTDPMPPVLAPVAAAQLPNGGRPSRRAEIEAAFKKAVATGAVDPARPLKEVCAVMHQRLGNGEGLSSRTLRRVVSGLVRHQREARV